MSKEAQSFARSLLVELCQRDERARVLTLHKTSRKAEIGIDDEGTWVPVLRVDEPSARYNVMSLWVPQGRSWVPTFQRGTPAMLADLLSSSLQHLWLPAAVMAAFDPSDPK